MAFKSSPCRRRIARFTELAEFDVEPNSMTRKPTIAIVNNEKNILSSLSKYLESEQFAVRRYPSAVEALDLIDDPADIALLDRSNPPLGGLELFRLIRSRHAMPVIFLSAWAEEISAELFEAGLEADDYIPVPFSNRHVVAIVRAVLARHPPRPSIALVVNTGQLC